MEAVELLNRKDTKYFFDREKLGRILDELAPGYRVLTIDGRTVFSYRNIYFDTPEFSCYSLHHNQRVNRYKLRIRQYVESDLVFFEIKFKTNTGRTIKSRIRIPDFNEVLPEEAKEFIRLHTPYDPDALRPTLRNDFSRFTLVNKQLNERITIDIDLNFSVNDMQKALRHICIAELKMDGSSSGSAFKAIMRENLCPEARISKYTIGAAFMYAGLKQNNFKLKKLQINRIENGSIANAG